MPNITLRNGQEATPINEFEFMNYDGPAKAYPEGMMPPAHATLTCVNHQDLRWTTKNPYQRSVHYIGLADGIEITAANARYTWQDCECDFRDLVVILEKKIEECKLCGRPCDRCGCDDMERIELDREKAGYYDDEGNERDCYDNYG